MKSAGIKENYSSFTTHYKNAPEARVNYNQNSPQIEISTINRIQTSDKKHDFAGSTKSLDLTVTSAEKIRNL
jgi:hypothetical protein